VGLLDSGRRAGCAGQVGAVSLAPEPERADLGSVERFLFPGVEPLQPSQGLVDDGASIIVAALPDGQLGDAAARPQLPPSRRT